MPARFYILRMSLSQENQLPLDEVAGPPLTREEYLRSVFSRAIVFQHRRKTFHYVPTKASPSQPIMAGGLGREFVAFENLAPEAGFEAVMHRGWKAAVVAIDPAHHDDGNGQRVVINHDPDVGMPFPVFASLVSAINEADALKPYHIEVEPLFDPQSFWTFAERHPHQVTTVAFNLTTPNPWGGLDGFEKDLQDMRDDEHAHTVRLSLHSGSGLRVNTPRIKQLVDYARKGRGTITARAQDGSSYNSTSKATTVKLDDRDGKESLLERVSRDFNALFGR